MNSHTPFLKIALILQALSVGGAIASDAPHFEVKAFCESTVSYGRNPVGPDGLPERFSDAPWAWLQFPTEESRRVVFDSMLNYRYIRGDQSIREIDFVAAADTVEVIRGPGNLRTISQFDAEYRKGYLLGWALCAFYSPLDTIGCARALNRNLDLSEPYVDIAFRSIYLQVLGDERALKGIFLLADRMKKLISSGACPRSGLFEDLQSVFRELGDDQAEAAQRAWSVMALFSTGGPNTAIRLFSRFGTRTINSARVAAAVLVVTTGAQVLDARTVGSGNLYSLPRGVGTVCDNGKPYHFWMSAYLARRAKMEGASTGASRLAAWLIEVGYQMRSDSFERDPTRPFTVAWDEPGNGKIRLDLAYSAAGAIYGAASVGGSPVVNLDTGLVAMIEGAEHLEPLTPASATSLYDDDLMFSFLRWNRLFAPKDGYDSIRRSRPNVDTHHQKI